MVAAAEGGVVAAAARVAGEEIDEAYWVLEATAPTRSYYWA